MYYGGSRNLSVPVSMCTGVWVCARDHADDQFRVVLQDVTVRLVVEEKGTHTGRRHNARTNVFNRSGRKLQDAMNC